MTYDFVARVLRLSPCTLLSLLVTGCVCQGIAPPRHDVVIVPAGWFWMGADEGRSSNRPRHRVFVEAFAMDRVEVTASESAAFVATTGRAVQGWEEESSEDEADHPAIGILWRDADACCR